MTTAVPLASLLMNVFPVSFHDEGFENVIQL